MKVDFMWNYCSQCKFEFIKILVPLFTPCILSEEIVKLLTIILPSFYCSPKKAIFSLFQAKMSSDQHGLGMQKGKILNDKYISNFSCGVLRYLTPCYCYVLCTLSTYWVLDYALASRWIFWLFTFFPHVTPEECSAFLKAL